MCLLFPWGLTVSPEAWPSHQFPDQISIVKIPKRGNVQSRVAGHRKVFKLGPTGAHWHPGLGGHTQYRTPLQAPFICAYVYGIIFIFYLSQGHVIERERLCCDFLKSSPSRALNIPFTGADPSFACLLWLAEVPSVSQTWPPEKPSDYRARLPSHGPCVVLVCRRTR